MSCRRPSNASSRVTGPWARSVRGWRQPRPWAGAGGPRRSRRFPGCAPFPEPAACPVRPGRRPGRRPRAGSVRWWRWPPGRRGLLIDPSWRSPLIVPGQCPMVVLPDRSPMMSSRPWSSEGFTRARVSALPPLPAPPPPRRPAASGSWWPGGRDGDRTRPPSCQPVLPEADRGTGLTHAQPSMNW